MRLLLLKFVTCLCINDCDQRRRAQRKVRKENEIARQTNASRLSERNKRNMNTSETKESDLNRKSLINYLTDQLPTKRDHECPAHHNSITNFARKGKSSTMPDNGFGVATIMQPSWLRRQPNRDNVSQQLPPAGKNGGVSSDWQNGAS